MTDLEYLLKLVGIQRAVATDVMASCPKGSPSWNQTKGAIGAYDTVEAYINNLICEKVERR